MKSPARGGVGEMDDERRQLLIADPQRFLDERWSIELALDGLDATEAQKLQESDPGVINLKRDLVKKLRCYRL